MNIIRLRPIRDLTCFSNLGLNFTWYRVSRYKGKRGQKKVKEKGLDARETEIASSNGLSDVFIHEEFIQLIKTSINIRRIFRTGFVIR